MTWRLVLQLLRHIRNESIKPVIIYIYSRTGCGGPTETRILLYGSTPAGLRRHDSQKEVLALVVTKKIFRIVWK